MDSCKLETFQSGSKGRGIRAKQRIKAGECLISEKPLVSVLMNSKCRGDRCDYCFGPLEKPLKCSKCKFTYYCNKSCQAGDWPLHKKECKCLCRSVPRQPPDFCRIIALLIFKFYGKNKALPDPVGGVIENLNGNADSITSTRKEAFFTFGAVLNEYLQGYELDLSVTDVYELMCKISCNSFSITNSEMNSLGTGVYKTAALLNHSCDPNCCAMFDGTTINIRSMKDIAAGEELFISYTDLMAPSSVRIAELQEGYMFTCDCNMCTSNEVRDHLMKSVLCKKCRKTKLEVPVEDLENLLTLCKCEGDLDSEWCTKQSSCIDDLQALYNEIKVVPTAEQQERLDAVLKRASPCLSHANLAVLHGCEVGMDGCLEKNDWKGAVAYSLTLAKGYQLYLTEYHPTLGIHYFKQGKLQILLDDMVAGITSLQKALRILSVSHGVNHELVQHLKQSLSEATTEMAEREKWQTIEKVYNEW